MAGGCSPGMAACASTCGHYQRVKSYREERERQVIRAENQSLGYSTELADWLRDNPLPTFKEFLIQTRQDTPMANHQYKLGDRVTDGQQSMFDADAQRAMRSHTASQAAEASLLSVAMSTDHGAEILKGLDVKSDFAAVPVHRHIAEVIVEKKSAIARDGVLNPAEAQALGRRHALPAHDAAVVTDTLRERNQLPLELDPKVPLRTVDPERYGLGAWQTYSPPAVAAGPLAAEVRTWTQQRYLADAAQRQVERAQVAIELNTTIPVSLAGDMQLAAAQDLVNMPRALGQDGKPLIDPATGKQKAQELSTTAVDTTKIRRATVEKPDRKAMRLPTPPQLSPVGRQALNRRSA